MITFKETFALKWCFAVEISNNLNTILEATNRPLSISEARLLGQFRHQRFTFIEKYYNKYRRLCVRAQSPYTQRGGAFTAGDLAKRAVRFLLVTQALKKKYGRAHIIRVDSFLSKATLLSTLLRSKRVDVLYGLDN